MPPIINGRDQSGEGDLEEEDDLDVLNFPSEKTSYSLSIDCIRSMEGPGNESATADSLLRKRYQKNHHGNLSKKSSLRRQTKI